MSFFVPPAPCSLVLSESAIHWIVRQELRLIRPDGSYSPSPLPPLTDAYGILIGINYDLAYKLDEDVVADWEGYVPHPVLEVLADAASKFGRNALRHHRSMPSITIPFQDALRFFREKTVPIWVERAFGLWPRFTDLFPAQQSALLSLIMHLGTGVRGPSRREIAQIVESLAAGQTGPIPQLIRARAFAYPPGPKHRRLLAEATLFSSTPY
jgi:hypothetical protein